MRAFQVLRTWGAFFPAPFLLTAPKETVEKAIPAFRGQVSPGGEFLFVRTKRNQKCAGGAGAEELQAPRARFRSKRLHPRIPDLRGIRIRGACAAFRRGGKPTLEATIFRCRYAGNCRTPPGLRNRPGHSIGPARRATEGRWDFFFYQH